MIDKFNMTKTDNVLAARRVLLDSIWKNANLAGIPISYARTNDLLNDVPVPEIKPSESNWILALRAAWEWMVGTIDTPLDWRTVEILHRIIAPFGHERWLKRPEQAKADWDGWMRIENETERAISVLIGMTRSPWFQDGSESVALLVANKILIENGRGVLQIPVELDTTFRTLLDGEENTLKDWLFAHCLDGTVYSEQFLKEMENEEACKASVAKRKENS